MPRKKFENKTVQILAPVGFNAFSYGAHIVKHRHNVLMFLDYLNWKPMIGKKDRGDPQEITVESLTILFGRKNLVKPIRDAMIKAQLLECDYKSYKNENCSKAFGYRMGSAIRNCAFRPYYIQDQRAIKRLEAFRQSIVFNIPDKKVSSQIVVEEPASYKFIRTSLSKLSVKSGFEEQIDNEVWDAKSKKRKKKRQMPSVDIDPKAQAKSALHIIAQETPDNIDFMQFNKTYIKADKQGRIYHPMTNLNKRARHHILLNNKELHEVDMVNAQLYLLAMLILEIAGSLKNPKKISEIIRYHTLPTTEKIQTRWYYCNEYHSVPEKLVGLPPDFVQFVLDTCSGEIYERVMHQLPHMDRGTIKYETIVGLMAEPWRAARMEPYKVLTNLYPSVGKLVGAYKTDHGHKWIGRTLQSMESAMIIGHVCNRVGEMGIETIPLHDCLFAVEEDIEIVGNVIIDVFVENFSWKPTIKFKKVSGPQKLSELC